MKHIISFFRSPVGYLFNFAATVNQYLPMPGADRFLSWGCENFCAYDDVQQDPLF